MFVLILNLVLRSIEYKTRWSPTLSL